MKKIPTLFERVFENHRKVDILPNVTIGMEWVLTYWNIGKRIVEQEMGGSERAEYGKGLISALAEDLTKEFGKNYSIRNLHYYIKFYQCFPDEQIVNACVHNLNWTHIRSLLRVSDEKHI